MTDNNYFAAFDDAANSGQQKSQPKVAESTAPASSSGNYFSSFDNAANDSPQKQSAMPSGADEGAFMAGVDKINQMGSDLATNTLLPIMKVLRIGDDSTYSKFTSLNQQANVQANNSANIHPWGSAAGGLLMGGMEGAAAGMGAAALGAGATLAGAASGAVPTFLSSPGSLTDRAVPTAVAGVAGGALGYLGSKLLDGTAQAAKDVQPIVDAKNKVQDLINNAKVPDIDKIQKTFYDTIAPNTHLAPEETQALLQDPGLKKFFDQVNSSDIGVAKDYADTSLAKWDAVKKELQNVLYGKNDVNTNLTVDDAKGLMQSQDKLINVLDNSQAGKSTDYQTIRQLGEKDAMYKQLAGTDAGSLNAKPDMPGSTPFPNTTDNQTTNKSIGKLLDTIAGTPAKKDIFLDQVAKSGGDPNNALDVINSLNSLRVSAPEKIVARTIANPATEGFSKDPGFVDKLMNGGYNSAVSKLLLAGPDQQAMMEKALAGKSIDSATGLKAAINFVKDQPLLHSPVARDAATGYLGQQASQNRYTRAAAVVGAIEGAHTLAHPISSVAGFLK